MRFDWPLLVFAAAVITAGVLCATVGPPSLDRAQAKFETADDRARQYNWPVFSQANSLAKLKCRDVSSQLRVCDVTFQAIDPMTGQPDGWVHEPFACSTTDCGWLKP